MKTFNEIEEMIFELAVQSVFAEGGDGDFTIICHNQNSLNEIYTKFEKWAATHDIAKRWSKQSYSKNDHIVYGDGEEYIIFRTKENTDLNTIFGPTLKWYF